MPNWPCKTISEGAQSTAVARPSRPGKCAGAPLRASSRTSTTDAPVSARSDPAILSLISRFGRLAEKKTKGIIWRAGGERDREDSHSPNRVFSPPPDGAKFIPVARGDRYLELTFNLRTS